MRLTGKLEHYIFQWSLYTAALRGQCEYFIEVYKVLIFPLIALTHRVIASRLCERSFHTDGDASSDAAMQLTEKLEHYIFQWFFHSTALRVQCEYIIEI